MRIGLLVAGALSPDASSGTPSALAEAFAAAGHEVVPVDVVLAKGVNRVVRTVIGARLLFELRGSLDFLEARRLAFVTADYCRVASRRVSRTLGEEQFEADVLVQYGTTFLPPAGIPMVTYEDMTSLQASRYPYWPAAHLSPQSLARRVAYQRAVYARASRCCVTTEWPARSIVEDFGVAKTKVRVVGVGRNYRPQARAARDWKLARYLFVGRDWERKNGPGLLEAFGRVRARLPHAELAIVGPSAAPEPPGVKAYGNLRFGRERDRQLLERLYEQATCFVLPSLCEPSGVSYVEAMSAGLPVIVSTEGGSRHVVGEAGILIDPRDSDGLVHAMLRLADPEIAAPMATAAIARAPGYEWSTVTRRMLADL